jgi:hypothetical protein
MAIAICHSDEARGEDRAKAASASARQDEAPQTGSIGMAYIMSRNHGEGVSAPGHTRAIPRSRLVDRGVSTSILAVTVFAAAALGGCASGSQSVVSSSSSAMFPESKWGVSASRRVVDHSGEVPKGGGVYKVGAPYKVGGRWYQPREQPDYDRVGTASWYGSDFHGRHTANGEVYDMHALTAAHPTLPMPSYAYVTNLSNNRTILVRINDRGPYVGDRMIDLSRASADAGPARPWHGTRARPLCRTRAARWQRSPGTSVRGHPLVAGTGTGRGYRSRRKRRVGSRVRKLPELRQSPPDGMATAG